MFHIDSYDEHFSRTIAMLPLLDLINDIHSKKLNNMKMNSPDVKFPPLHEEVFPKRENCWFCGQVVCHANLWVSVLYELMVLVAAAV